MKKENERLTQEVLELQENNNKLTKMNEALSKNISCLFKTAQIEIQRKNKEINVLRGNE